MQEHFAYNEDWAQNLLDRGGSRTDRCSRHRKLHNQAIQGIAVAYIDVKTLGEVRNLQSPHGPLGGLGPLPETHKGASVEVDLAAFQFGMNDDHIREMLDKLSDPDRRVLILKAGTGTGKSTFGPFRLMFPPDDAQFRLADLGQMIVTEPRVPATTGVARFVGEKLVMGCALKECTNPDHGSFNPRAHVDDPDGLTGAGCDDASCIREHIGSHPGYELDDCVVVDCSRHIGPGYRVGYQVANDKNHDAACQIVYVTDGTMINWLREGRLSNIGTVIVDEAHERSTNIDFILGYLRRELNNYPHLRVIVTSATFDVDFYVDYFGGPAKVHQMDVPAEKSFGYGAPLFPMGSATLDCACEARRESPGGDLVMPHPPFDAFEDWLDWHWPESTIVDAVIEPDEPEPIIQDGRRWDNSAEIWRPLEEWPSLEEFPSSDARANPDSPSEVRQVTRLLYELRAQTGLNFPSDGKLDKKWRQAAGRSVAKHVIRLVERLTDWKVSGDILAFLPNVPLIEAAVDMIRESVDPELNDVFALNKDAPGPEKEAAQAPRPPGAKRKIVIATNLAETSLTISGVRFVIDAGMNTQGEWDAALASKTIPTKLHSQSGIRQRWGRVGRDAPGWVFPLYSKSDFESLAADTPPGSTRDNLEQLVMKAKAAGIDDVVSFKWPAAHVVTGKTEADLDPRVVETMKTFAAEIVRADGNLLSSGAIDADGHLTELGKELDRFGQFSADFAIATMLADQLTCAPEVVTALVLLEAEKPQGFEKLNVRGVALRDQDWPGEWLVQADRQWRHLWSDCRDDLDFAIRIFALWELADPETKPWIPSAKRAEWAAYWWLDNDVLLLGAELRRTVLSGLSAKMTEEVKRFLDPRLAPRARAVISRAYNALRHTLNEDNTFQSVARPSDVSASLVTAAGACRRADLPADVIPLVRQRDRNDSKAIEIDNIVEATPWACNPDLSALDLLLLCRENCHPERLDAGQFDQVIHVASALPPGTLHRTKLVSPDAQHSLELVGKQFSFPGEPPAFDPNPTAGWEEFSSSTSQVPNPVLDKDVAWPTGNPFPQEDEAVLSRRHLVDVEAVDRDPSTGRTLGPETNDDDFDGTPTTFPLNHSNDKSVRWAVQGDQTGDLFVVSGYATDDLGGIAVLQPLMEAPDTVRLAAVDPSGNADLTPGQPTDVVVGPMILVPIAGSWSKSFRELIRHDGKGRFLVSSGRPATANPVAALDRNDWDFLDRLKEDAVLTGTVVPTKYGTMAFSLVPNLSRHLDAAHKVGFADAGDKSWYWPAKVAGEANSNGYVPVELLSRDSQAGVTHRFGVRGTDIDRVMPDTEPLAPIKLSLKSNSAALVGPRDELEQVRARHERSFFPDNGVSRGEVTALKSRGALPLPALQLLLNAVPDDPQWPPIVWDFYLQSHLRYVGGFTTGTDDIDAEASLGPGRTLRSETDGAVSLSPAVQIAAELPTHLQLIAPHITADLERRVGCRVSFGGQMLSAFALDVEAAQRLAVTLGDLLSGPCIRVVVPERKMGAVIGRGGATIRALSEMDGILYCNFAGGGPYELSIVAESTDKLRNCLTAIIHSISRPTRAVLEIPVSGKVAALFGPGGARIKQLNAVVGITRIDTGDRGSRLWHIQAESRDAVLVLLHEVQQTVPGCTIDLLPQSEPQIVDVVAGHAVTEWQVADFSTTLMSFSLV